jgi:hypothetical protein
MDDEIDGGLIQSFTIPDYFSVITWEIVLSDPIP